MLDFGDKVNVILHNSTVRISDVGKVDLPEGMKMDKDIVAVVVAFTLGALIGMAILAGLTDDKVTAYDTAIEQCEKELPRNQHCVISAEEVK